MTPALPTEVEPIGEDDSGAGVDLYVPITLERTYRVRAFAREGEALRPLLLPLVPPISQPMKVWFESFVPSQTRAKVEEIVLRFWPPVEGVDDASPWWCRCGRPSGDMMDGDGHWEHRIKIDFDDPMENIW